MERKKLVVLVGLVFGLLAILVLAASLSQIQMESGIPFVMSSGEDPQLSQPNSEVPVELDGTLRIFLTILFLVVTPISIIYVILNPKSWKRILKNVGIVMLLLLMILAFTSLFDGAFRQGQEGAEQSQQAPPSQGNGRSLDDININPPSWVGFAVGFLILFLMIGVGLIIWYKRRRNSDDDGEIDKLIGGAEDALRDLRAGANLRDTVIRCYHEMCQTMGEQRGVRRMRAMTPREFESHLANAGFKDEHIVRLTRLFESVRYGDQRSQPEMEREAKDCLEAIVSTYERSAT